ncbi:MAG: 4-hydroxythreonine-4-phosphate dehydrogenase PdxA [Acidimicrobiaceae bacterium]|nr:4-hydroxythreonine-4-phosphate dehydrogenase PdxA [Acidimicrobiaceae bacterium]
MPAERPEQAEATAPVESAASLEGSAQAEGAGRPVIGITMGDGAGIGPEVVVKALAHPEAYELCRPLVIGDRHRLAQAASVSRLAPAFRSIDKVSEGRFVPGTIDVFDLGVLPDDLEWGKLSAVAGEGAFQYIRVAVDLALAGDIQAICTAPLNKEALHAAGHLYPGHTELLAELTGTPEVSMMLTSDKVRVIHVTTHIGLLDAVERIEPGLVLRTIRRGHRTLVDAGVANPSIAVCGINPHAGENGLFGRGEEEVKIAPAIAAAQAEGIDARGPLPADTVFFRAGRGDFDLVVAMYHDQGHGPVKILGLEAGVNITVGLPVIRTSVDHGTAFDIAGTGVAEDGSLLEALRQAATLAPPGPATVSQTESAGLAAKESASPTPPGPATTAPPGPATTAPPGPATTAPKGADVTAAKGDEA